MKTWTDEFGTIFAEPDCADEWLELIYDMGIGYDGMHTVKGLQELIDEMMEMAKKARACLREGFTMNNDLISRSALLADIQTDVEDGGVSGMVAGALRRYVRRAPAVDASTGTAEGGVTMPIDEYVKASCWIVCPMCDEPKCVGRFNCPEIKAWIEKKRRADE